MFNEDQCALIERFCLGSILKSQVLEVYQDEAKFVHADPNCSRASSYSTMDIVEVDLVDIEDICTCYSRAHSSVTFAAPRVLFEKKAAFELFYRLDLLEQAEKRVASLTSDFSKISLQHDIEKALTDVEFGSIFHDLSYYLPVEAGDHLSEKSDSVKELAMFKAGELGSKLIFQEIALPWVRRDLEAAYQFKDPAMLRAFRILFEYWESLAFSNVPQKTRKVLVLTQQSRMQKRAVDLDAEKLRITTDMWLKDAESLFMKYVSQEEKAPCRLASYGIRKAPFEILAFSLKTSAYQALVNIPLSVQKYLSSKGANPVRCTKEFVFLEEEAKEIASSLWDTSSLEFFNDLEALSSSARAIA